MKKFITVIMISGLLVITGLYAKRKFHDPSHRLENATKQVSQLAGKDDIKNGDIIFQISLSGQSKAIQLATHSEFSHCGIIYRNGND